MPIVSRSSVLHEELFCRCLCNRGDVGAGMELRDWCVHSMVQTRAVIGRGRERIRSLSFWILQNDTSVCWTVGRRDADDEVVTLKLSRNAKTAKSLPDWERNLDSGYRTNNAVYKVWEMLYRSRSTTGYQCTMAATAGTTTTAAAASQLP